MTPVGESFALEQLLAQVRAARERQPLLEHADYPDGTGPETLPLIFLESIATAQENQTRAREWIQVAGEEGGATFRDVLLADVLTAFAAADARQLHRALVEVVATALRWTESVDRRARDEKSARP